MEPKGRGDILLHNQTHIVLDSSTIILMFDVLTLQLSLVLPVRTLILFENNCKYKYNLDNKHILFALYSIVLYPWNCFNGKRCCCRHCPSNSAELDACPGISGIGVTCTSTVGTINKDWPY